MTERYRNESERLARKVPGLLHELRGAEWRKLTALMERRRLELGAQYRWPGPPRLPPRSQRGRAGRVDPTGRGGDADLPEPAPSDRPDTETPVPSPVEPVIRAVPSSAAPCPPE